MLLEVSFLDFLVLTLVVGTLVLGINLPVKLLAEILSVKQS